MNVQQKLPPPILFTKKGYEEAREKEQQLLVERPDAVEELRKARAMGDLSENGYYKAARARLSSIDGRLRRLKKVLKRAKIVESSGSGAVEIGSTVTISTDGRDSTYTIVGGHESDPAKQTISYMSPLGKALMRKREGDTAVVHAPKGEMTYTIQDIS